MMTLKKEILPVILAVLMLSAPAALAQDCPEACRQDDFPAFVDWYSNLNGEEQFNRLNGIHDKENRSRCGRDPIWKEKAPEHLKNFKSPKMLFNDEELKSEHRVRRIVDVSPTLKRVEEGQDGKRLHEIEFIWDGRCWWLTQVAIPIPDRGKE